MDAKDQRVSRSMSNMESYFRAIVAEFPKAIQQGRTSKWAAAVHSYIDLIACEEEHARLAADNNQTPAITPPGCPR